MECNSSKKRYHIVCPVTWLPGKLPLADLINKEGSTRTLRVAWGTSVTPQVPHNNSTYSTVVRRNYVTNSPGVIETGPLLYRQRMSNDSNSLTARSSEGASHHDYQCITDVCFWIVNAICHHIWAYVYKTRERVHPYAQVACYFKLWKQILPLSSVLFPCQICAMLQKCWSVCQKPPMYEWFTSHTSPAHVAY